VSDVRYALRAIVRNPGFSLLAGISLAIGIGANTAIYSVIDTVLLRPLPAVARPESLVSIVSDVISYPMYCDLRDRARTFSDVAAFSARSVSFVEGGRARFGTAVLASGNFFQTLGVMVSEGRPLLPSDDEDGADSRVAVISRGLWQQHFGGEDALGQTLVVNGSAFRIVGVAPAGFRGASLSDSPDLWIPIHAWPQVSTGSQTRLNLQDDGWGWLRITARLVAGANMRQAETEVNQIDTDRERARGTQPGDPLRLASALTAAAGGSRHAEVSRFLVLLAGIVGVALLMACANVANLMMVRVTGRRKELAVRQALGARPSRILRLLVSEGIVLAVASGMFALMAAAWSLEAFRAFTLPGGIPLESLEVRFDARLLLVSLCLTLATGVVFSVWPAACSARADVLTGLRDTPGRTGSRLRTRQILLAVQVAACLVLVGGAALFTRSVRATLQTDMGFDLRHIATAAIAPQQQRYDSARTQRVFEDARRRALADPRVRAASWCLWLPLTGDRMRETVDVDGYVPQRGESRAVRFNAVGPGYFATMGIPMLAGRDFSDVDRAGSPLTAIVNESMARRYWPGRSAVDGRVHVLNLAFDVVGVAADSTYEELGVRSVPHVYVAIAQAPDAVGAAFLVRGDRDASTVVPVLRDALAAAAPDLPVREPKTFEDRVAALLMPQRFAGMLLTVFALAALALAAVGVYGVTAFTVAARTREIGLRVALGAAREDVARLVTSATVLPVAIGGVAGLGTAWVLARLAAGFLRDISPYDGWSFALAAGAMLACAAAASWVPLRRALAVEPAAALRTE
jgi:putative ABC transport system permease protein